MVSENNKQLEEQLEVLFWDLHSIDENYSGDLIRFLVMRMEEIEIRMDGDKNHARPHIHIKYRKDGHAASYAIDDGSRLAGKLPKRYDRRIAGWIIENNADLKGLWASTQSGKRNEAILLKFQTMVAS